MIGTYWRRVAAYAWRRSCRAVGLNERGRIVIAFLTALTVVAVLLFWGSQDAAGDMALERGVIWALAALSFFSVLVWNLIKAPAEIDQEREIQIGALKGKLLELEKTAAQQNRSRIDVLLLSVLSENGHDLFSSRLLPTQYDDWLARVSAWERVGLAILATKFSHQDAIAFKNVKFDPRKNVAYATCLGHNEKLLEINVRLDVLKEIVGRHQQSWAPCTKQEKEEIEKKLLAIEAKVVTPNSD